MDVRELGRTGLKVSRIGLGTVKFGRNTGVKYPAPFELPTDDEVDVLLRTAAGLGINLIDTAPAYGTSEERLKPFLAGHRESVILSTKCGETFDGTASFHDFSAAAITASLDRSLERMGVSFTDLCLLHSNGEDEEILLRTDALEGLKAAKRAGKVKAIGISAKTARGIELARGRVDVVMAPYGIGNESLGEALSRASGGGVGIIAIKGLGAGHAATGPDAVRRAVRFVLSAPFVDSLVVGTLNPAHLTDIVAAVPK